jgi:Domain of unknown function (DUF5916)/Carbohydrate family 9 binding domain-like
MPSRVCAVVFALLLAVLFTVLSAHCLLAAPVAAKPSDANASQADRRLPAVRATGPIVVDGVIEESAWTDAPVATGFLQSEPHEGEPASEETEARVLYDDEHLYIGAFIHEADAHEILVAELKKDFDIQGSDVFEVVLDTFHDERNGYLFAVNAMGARWDAQMVNEGRDVNGNWDGVWSAQTRIVRGGWTVEIAIPFRTLRFPAAGPGSWGINFLRRIRHKNEDTFWAPIPRIHQITRVSLAGTLDGLQAVRPGRDFRLKPYALGSANRGTEATRTGDMQAGLDAKWGVTTGLTWDFTVNTDFSQVEADEQQVNLTRFNLFFPEKRDFFLENSGVFQFGPGDQRGMLLGGGGGGGGGGRTNSLADNVLFFSRQIGLSSDGDPLPILGGTRLTGHAGQYSIGAMNIQQRARGEFAATNFTAVRLRRNVLANSDVGAMMLNKAAAGGAYNRFAGADANFRFFSNFNVNAYAGKTFSPASVVGTTGSDTIWRGGFAYRGRLVDGRASYSSLGQRFNDELGFIPRTGIDRLDAAYGMHFRPKAVSGWLREIYPHWQMVNITKPGAGAFDSRFIDYHLPFTLQNSTFVETGVNANVEVLTDDFEINPTRGIIVPPGRYEYNEYFILATTDRGKRLSFNARYGAGPFYDGQKQSSAFGGQVRASARLTAGVNWSRNVVDLQNGAYTTDLIASRVNFSFSTRMFLNALLQYNTDANQLSANVRFNVIHRPLSDVFIVYNDRRDSVNGVVLDRALVAKVTYLLAF